MTTDYDPISELYRRSKFAPWRTYVECHSLHKLVGDVTGLHVLDVACGEGFYSRFMKLQGAASVTGIDLSTGMVELAQQQETEHPLGIQYRQGDARDLTCEIPADLVVSAYLLNYATSEQELTAMLCGIARCLKPGGRFVTVNCSQTLDFRECPSYRQYGFETSASDPWEDGTPITWTFFLTDSEFSIENYHLSPEAHERAFKTAGFDQFRWVAPEVAPKGIDDHGDTFWKTFLNHPPITLIDCTKSTTV